MKRIIASNDTIQERRIFKPAQIDLDLCQLTIGNPYQVQHIYPRNIYQEPKFRGTKFLLEAIYNDYLILPGKVPELLPTTNKTLVINHASQMQYSAQQEAERSLCVNQSFLKRLNTG